MTRPDIDFDGDSFRPRSAAGDAFLARAFSALVDDLTQAQMADICARAELAGLKVRKETRT